MTSPFLAGAALLLAAALTHPGAEARDGAAAEQQSEGTQLRAVVYPRIARSPAILRIQAFVEPSASNRALHVVVESAEYFRSSTISLDGADEPRLHTVHFRSVPVGTHDIRITLTGADGRVRGLVTDRVAVLE